MANQMEWKAMRSCFPLLQTPIQSLRLAMDNRLPLVLECLPLFAVPIV